MRILTKAGYIDGAALMFEITDSQLNRIKGQKDYYLDQSFMDEAKNSKGDNAHIIMLFNNGSPTWIYKNIKTLLTNYKTVSWWDKEQKQFKITRRESCLG